MFIECSATFCIGNEAKYFLDMSVENSTTYIFQFSKPFLLKKFSGYTWSTPAAKLTQYVTKGDRRILIAISQFVFLSEKVEEHNLFIIRPEKSTELSILHCLALICDS